MRITGEEVNALAELLERADGLVNNDVPTYEDKAIYLLLHGVATIPCTIGSTAYAIRRYKGVPRANMGRVSAMFYNENMQLVVVVGGIARGIWGRDIFATRGACEKAIKVREKKCQSK